MNPVLVFLILIGAVALWFLCSFKITPLGKFMYRLFKDAVDEINKEDETEKETK